MKTTSIEADAGIALRALKSVKTALNLSAIVGIFVFD